VQEVEELAGVAVGSGDVRILQWRDGLAGSGDDVLRRFLDWLDGRLEAIAAAAANRNGRE
jgi:hypothetical protein